MDPVEVEPLQQIPQLGNERSTVGLIGVAFDPALDIGEAAMERQAGELIQDPILRHGMPGHGGPR